MARDRTSTGYEGIEPPPETGKTVWRVKRLTLFSSQIPVQILRNDFPCGILYLPSEEEVEWLTRVLTSPQ